MRQLLGILILVLSATFSAALANAYGGGVISAGGNHTCALDNSGVRCWGDNSKGQSTVPALKNPKMVSAGYFHTCALDDSGVKCWGDKGDGRTSVPVLKNPKSVQAGFRHTCALDDSGVKCWGSNYGSQIDVPKNITNPKMLSVGYFNTCADSASNSGQVTCWGENSADKTRVPGLINPKMISSGGYHSCALADMGVTCWGENSRGQTTIPRLKHPKMVSAGERHTCALDDSGVQCWGYNEFGQITVPTLKNPKAVSAGGMHTCALDEDGVKCWGSIKEGQVRVPALDFGPKFNDPKFTFKQVNEFLKVLTFASTPARNSFFSKVLVYSEANLNGFENSSPYADLQLMSAKYLLASLLSPAVVSGDSSYYLEKVIPAYKNSMAKISADLGINGLANLKSDSVLARQTALQVMQISIAISNEFLSIDDRAKTAQVTKSIGQAMANSASRQAVLDALNAVRANEVIFNKLQDSSKTSFLVTTLKTATQWLESQIR